jgi:hypothetical protein
MYAATATTTFKLQGMSWQAMAGPGVPNTRAIAVDDNGVHFVGDNNLHFYYDGTIWHLIGWPGTLGIGDLLGVWAAPTGEVVAGGPYGFFRYDGSWAFVNGFVSAHPIAPMTGMWITSATTGYAAAGNIYVLNNQFSVSQSGTNSRAIWGALGTPNVVYAVGDAGSIWRNNGSWSKMNEPAQTPNLHGVHGTAANDVWAVGVAGTILHYTSTWAKLTSNTPNDLFAVWAASPTDAIAVGASGTIVRWNGATWSVVPAVTTRALRAVWGFAGNDIFAVGDAGTVLHWNGVAWSSMPTGTSRNLRGVWGPTSDDVFFAGEGSTVLHYDGFGITPVKMGGVVTPYYSVAGSGSTVFFGGAGPDGTSYRTGLGIERTAKWKRRTPP